MSTLELVLTLLTSGSLIGNITQFFSIKASRNKAQYDADNAHIRNLQMVIELQSQEIKRLSERVAALEKSRDEEREERLKQHADN